MIAFKILDLSGIPLGEIFFSLHPFENKLFLRARVCVFVCRYVYGVHLYEGLHVEVREQLL